MTLDTRTKPQKRAERWKELYEELQKENPEASSWKICEAIAKQTKHTTQAVFQRLTALGTISK